MPILKQEDDLFPKTLLDDEQFLNDDSYGWYSVYTVSRREKELMRRLTGLNIAHYGPVIPKRYRAPNGRLRTSYIPLFPNYNFLFGDEEDRYQAMTTNCISRWDEVPNRNDLVADLRQIRTAILNGIGLTPESRLEPGNQVRVRSGPFSGFEGTVIRREGKTKLLLSIRFLEQGVSMEMDEGLLEPL